MLILQGCGGDSSSTAENTKSLINNENPAIICTQQYEPVCGKTEPRFPVNCAQAPCVTHEYRTFPNICYADNALTQFAFSDECESLEEQMAFADKPVWIKEYADVPVDNAPVTITHAEINGDVAKLEVSYTGGCKSHEIKLIVSSLFMESNPVQTESILSHITEDSCDAVVAEELTFDLLPLREFYRRTYGEFNGSINIQGIGLYTF